MKAEESVKNYPSSLRMYCNYTTREIRKICKTIGPRGSGSESERKAQEHFKAELPIKLKWKISQFTRSRLWHGLFLTDYSCLALFCVLF